MPGLAEIRRLVGAYLPGRGTGSVAEIGAGLDNVAYEVDGELIVRFARTPDPARTEREARLLSAVAARSPVPVPAPVFVAAELGCIAYRKLPGTPLIDQPRGDATAVAATLGELLTALHTVPIGHWAGLADADDQPMTEWLRDAAEEYAAVADRVPVHRERIEAFLGSPPPDRGSDLVFSHNDLGIEHVLVTDEATVSGVIDWSDAALVDPAYDFGLILRDLGPAALDTALGGYPAHGNLRERARFYARCTVLEDLAYGLETGLERYRAKSIDALDWLYPLRSHP